MTTTTAPARELIPALVKADAARAAIPRPPHSSAALAEYDAWVAIRDAALTGIREAEESVKGLICQRCHGRGRIVIYTHRLGGVCFQCKGDGWTAKGRRWHADAEKRAVMLLGGQP
jgi:hypothetical protein